MSKDKTSDRRNFLKTAGAALVAASVPAAIAAQSNQARPPSGNNLKQLIIFAGVAEPLPSLPGVLGQACFQFQMRANLDGSGGFAALSDAVFSEINSHIQIQTSRCDINDIYIFQGTVVRSLSGELIGKTVAIKVQILPDDNCNTSLTIENTPVAGLLLPAIMKVRDKNGF